MYRPRLIPTLLLKSNGLVKSRSFKDFTYVGDPINAVRIFNEMKADEIVFLDITASREGRTIDLNFVKDVAEEANMPFSVGGGIHSLETIREIIAHGAEKVILNQCALKDPSFVKKAVEEFGSSTIAVCIDVKKKWLGGQKVYDHVRSSATGTDPLEFARSMEQLGVGELIIQSVDKDGSMQGYDIELIRSIATAVSIPVIALGGAGEISDMKKLLDASQINGLAAGSMFIFSDRNRGVLINYPDLKELHQLFPTKRIS